MEDIVNVALAGIGGYGELYVRSLLEERAGRRFVGAVDPFAERSKLLPDLKAKGIPVFPDMESLYKELRPDLMAISSPIQLHRPQSEYALAHGSSVICEKPVAGSLADALAMSEAESKSPGRFLAIGYQWSFSDAVMNLKADIAAGNLGRPLRMRSLILWPRPLSYYKRNSWVGAINAPDGTAVNDSPLNNATAHYLHNCLYLLGAAPGALQAELYRSNNIQNYDTVALRCDVGGTEVLFYSSHATRLALGPLCIYEFEKATVSYESHRRTFIAKFKDGSLKVYGNPEEQGMKKLDDCIAAVRSGARPVCCVPEALAQTRCMEAAKASSVPFELPDSEIEVLDNAGDPLTTIRGLPELFSLCFAEGALPSETNVASWTKAGRSVAASL